MAGYYSRRMYDACYQDQRKEIEEYNGQYFLNNIRQKNVYCKAPFTVVPIKNNTLSDKSTDLESYLLNLDVSYDKCQRQQPRPHGTTIPTSATCSNEMQTSYCRMEHPAIDVRSMTQSRFDFPIYDPRTHVYYGNGITQGDEYAGINTRLQARDMDPKEFYGKFYN